MVKKVEKADIIGMSAYAWNLMATLEIAKRIKKKNPNVLIIFGGPHVPDNAESFLNEHSYIDLACHSEGERTFTKILEKYPSRDWRKIPAISYIKNNKRTL